MKRGFTWIIIFMTVIAACAAYMLIKRSQYGCAIVESNGRIVRTIDFSRVDAPFDFTVNNGDHTNTVHVEKYGIQVTDSDCPDKICIRRGKITNSSVPIVCLPNKLVITIKKSDNTTADAVSGG